MLGFVNQRREAGVGDAVDAFEAFVALGFDDRLDDGLDVVDEQPVVDILQGRDAGIDPP